MNLPSLADSKASGTVGNLNFLTSATANLGFLGSGSSGGYGHKNNDLGTNCATIDICPDILIGGIFAAGAAAFGLLYTLITMVGRRRKKRGIKDNIIEYFDDVEMFKILFEDVVLTGMDKNARYVYVVVDDDIPS